MSKNSDELEYAGLTDNRFSRFDQELIDKYFNDRGKAEIEAYVTKAQLELLERLLDEMFILDLYEPIGYSDGENQLKVVTTKAIQAEIDKLRGGGL